MESKALPRFLLVVVVAVDYSLPLPKLPLLLSSRSESADSDCWCYFAGVRVEAVRSRLLLHLAEAHLAHFHYGYWELVEVLEVECFPLLQRLQSKQKRHSLLVCTSTFA